MSDIGSTLDKSVAAAKSTYVPIELANLETFLEKIFGARVSIESVAGGAAKSGSSSGILIFTASISRDGTIEKKKLVLRYDPKSDQRLFVEYDLKAEYQLLAKLSVSGLPVPAVFGLDATGEELGTPGFVMECIPGEPIPTSLFTSGPLVEANESQRQEIYLDILRNLAKVHNLDYVALGLRDFTKKAPGKTAQEKLTNWWWNTWEWARPPEYDRLVPIRDWLLEHAPVVEQPVLMHGDPNLGNYLVHERRVSAILDWELSSVGAPELDLAIQIVSMDPHRPSEDKLPVRPPSEAEWLAMYAKVGGKPLGNLDYYKVHAAYEILICMGSMCSYLPEDIVVQYRAMGSFYWTLADRIVGT
jgi:aminoglycoside phosphotransferase (APT) family kinase protein